MERGQSARVAPLFAHVQATPQASTHPSLTGHPKQGTCFPLLLLLLLLLLLPTQLTISSWRTGDVIATGWLPSPPTLVLPPKMKRAILRNPADDASWRCWIWCCVVLGWWFEQWAAGWIWVVLFCRGNASTLRKPEAPANRYTEIPSKSRSGAHTPSRTAPASCPPPPPPLSAWGRTAAARRTGQGPA